MGYRTPVTNEIGHLIEYFDNECDCGKLEDCKDCGTKATLEDINKLAQKLEYAFHEQEKKQPKLIEAAYREGYQAGRDYEVSE